MAENLYDLTLLLGVQYVTDLYSDKTDSFLEQFTVIPTPFWKHFPELLKQLKRAYGIKGISSIFKISVYFVNFILESGVRGGQCLLCDKFFYQVKRHMIEKHDFSEENCVGFYKMFVSAFYHMPTDFKPLRKSDSILKSKPQMLKMRKFVENSEINPFRTFYIVKGPVNRANEKNECVLCIECGQIVSRNRKIEHDRMHRKTENIECLGCGQFLKTKHFANHILQCFDIKTSDNLRLNV
ncbi:hypothetical protein SteCoe_26725 [Stentor coeruleus]|uniref:C2H2-type domain-containing protein n=1 Tax=Stentor coeruleus TaxID=5963 RepID=A0A1R2BCH6_9CILI|nr:hypothetical protein SteCoe_26725 [Stentor coeruleus]